MMAGKSSTCHMRKCGSQKLPCPSFKPLGLQCILPRTRALSIDGRASALFQTVAHNTCGQEPRQLGRWQLLCTWAIRAVQREVILLQSCSTSSLEASWHDHCGRAPPGPGSKSAELHVASSSKLLVQESWMHSTAAAAAVWPRASLSEGMTLIRCKAIRLPSAQAA